MQLPLVSWRRFIAHHIYEELQLRVEVDAHLRFGQHKSERRNHYQGPIAAMRLDGPLVVIEFEWTAYVRDASWWLFDTPDVYSFPERGARLGFDIELKRFSFTRSFGDGIRRSVHTHGHFIGSHDTDWLYSGEIRELQYDEDPLPFSRD